MKNRLLAILAAGLLTASAVLAQSEENLWLYPPPKASLPAGLKRFTRPVALNNIFFVFSLAFSPESSYLCRRYHNVERLNIIAYGNIATDKKTYTLKRPL